MNIIEGSSGKTFHKPQSFLETQNVLTEEERKIHSFSAKLLAQWKIETPKETPKKKRNLFTMLPDEVILYLFSFLNHHELLYLRLMDHRLNLIVKDPSLKFSAFMAEKREKKLLSTQVFRKTIARFIDGFPNNNELMKAEVEVLLHSLENTGNRGKRQEIIKQILDTISNHLIGSLCGHTYKTHRNIIQKIASRVFKNKDVEFYERWKDTFKPLIFLLIASMSNEAEVLEVAEQHYLTAEKQGTAIALKIALKDLLDTLSQDATQRPFFSVWEKVDL